MSRYKIIYTVFAVLSCFCFTCGAQQIFPVGNTLHKDLLELPDISQDEVIVIHQGYISSYNSEYLQPDWVAYELTAGELEGEVQRKGSFKKDPCLTAPQATNGDYSKSGFDKGHMAPAADMKWSEEVMGESFYFTNICPQTPALNRRNWLNLEKLARNAAQRYGKVWIISGSVVDTVHTVIGANKVAVPALFYKALLAFDGKKYVSSAFIMKNNDDNQPVGDVIMTVDSLELVIRRDLFCNLSEKDSVCEATVRLSDWD